MDSSNFAFYIETLGCPKNRVDSRRLKSSLLLNGFKEAADAKSADIILINSCSFIREAQEETIETTYQALKVKKVKNKQAKVGLIGCFPQRFEKETLMEIPELDFVTGTGKFAEIPYLLAKKFNIKLSANPGWKPASTNKKPYAYFQIAQGCSRSCSFCAIPAIRGNFYNYDIADIEQQYKEELLSRDNSSPLKEIILVSQDTNSSGKDHLKNVLDFFSSKEDVAWIRLHYLFPEKKIFNILKLWQEYPKLVPYLDLPLQHISSSILKKMNRPGDVELFREIISEMLRIRPDAEIRSSLIIGYPGETKEDIDQIKDFLAHANIDKLSLFRYSHEENTPSFSQSQDDVPDETKIERINDIRNYHLEQRKERRSALTGKIVPLMVDEISQNEIIARRQQDSPEIDEIVTLASKNKKIQPGDLIEGRIEMAMEYDFIAELI